MKKIDTVDEYIDDYPPDVQEILQTIRGIVRRLAPEATERMAYGIPTYTLKKNLIHFGAYPNHIGLYPGTQAIQAFEKELSPYETSKGTVRFPLGQPIPYNLIEVVVKYNIDLQN